MALIKCSECGHMISDKAMKCPKCGCPVEQAFLQDSSQKATTSENMVSNEPSFYENESGSHKWLYAIIGVLAVVLIGLCIWAWQSGLLDGSQKQANQIADSTAMANENISKLNGVHQLKGSIDKYGVEMMITVEKDDITGLLHYDSQKKGVNLSLKGNINENGKMTIDEYAPSSENTGRFEGTFDGTTFKGTFSNFFSGKTFTFTLSKVSSLSSLSEEDEVASVDEREAWGTEAADEEDDYSHERAVEELVDSAAAAVEEVADAAAAAVEEAAEAVTE